MNSCQAFSSALAKKGMSPQQLAAQSGCNQARIDGICAGTVTPTSQEYNLIAGALGMSPPSGNHPR